MLEHGMAAMTPDERDRLVRTEQQVNNLSEDMREVKADVRLIRDTMASTLGGWKLVLVLGGFISGAVLVADKILGWVF